MLASDSPTSNFLKFVGNDDDDSDDDFSDDEELQSPIDDVDPFVFFVDTIKGKLKNVQVNHCHHYCSLYHLTCPPYQLNFSCSDTIIGSIEVCEPYPNA